PRSRGARARGWSRGARSPGTDAPRLSTDAHHACPGRPDGPLRVEQRARAAARDRAGRHRRLRHARRGGRPLPGHLVARRRACPRSVPRPPPDGARQGQGGAARRRAGGRDRAGRAAGLLRLDRHPTGARPPARGRVPQAVPAALGSRRHRPRAHGPRDRRADRAVPRCGVHRAGPPRWSQPPAAAAGTNRGPYFATTAHGPDLFAAAQQAVRYMIDHLVAERGLAREEAYIVSSVAVDLKISEIVDTPNWIVSAFLPECIFAPSIR